MKKGVLVALGPVALVAAWVVVQAQQRVTAFTAQDYAEIGQLANRYALAIDTCSNNGYD